MDLSNLLCLLILTTLVFFTRAYPSDIRPSSESDSDRPPWLNDLESQIFSDPEELSSFLSPKRESHPDVSKLIPVRKVIGEAEYDTADLVEEPLVVTERPYLLGPPDPEEIEETTMNPIQPEETDHYEPSESEDSSVDSIPISTTASPDMNEETTTNRNVKSTFEASVLLNYLTTTQSTQMIFDGTSSNYDDYSTNTTTLDVDTIRTLRNNGRYYDSHKVLDKIVLDIEPISIPRNSDTLKKSPGSSEENQTTKSEVKSFVVLIRNQTLFIILGCILSTIILVALIFLTFRLRKTLNNPSAITLIAHNDYDDNRGLKKVGDGD